MLFYQVTIRREHEKVVVGDQQNHLLLMLSLVIVIHYVRECHLQIVVLFQRDQQLVDLCEEFVARIQQ